MQQYNCVANLKRVEQNSKHGYSKKNNPIENQQHLQFWGMYIIENIEYKI